MFTRALLFLLLVAAPVAFATDLERAMILVPPTGTAPEDVAIAAAQKHVADPKPTLAWCERLGWAYIAKARRTLDAGYYRLAATTADVMDRQFGPTPEAALLRGHVDHNLHRFADAERVARQLVKDRGLPEDWALLSDALMEQGKLTAAVDALQHMENLKPGAEADTRIAHLRWLKGDLRGAMAAMAEAVRETSPTDRVSLAWMLSRLSGYLLQVGNLDEAAKLAEQAAAHVSDYAPALLAQGKVALLRGDAAEAMHLFTRAERLNPLPEYQWWLADACRQAGDLAGAQRAEAALAATGATADPRTYALYLATRGEHAATALKLAQDELANRQDVFTHDALAWALRAHGERAVAWAHMRTALAAGTKDARLFLHAAVIARENGDAAAAQRYAEESRAADQTLLPSEHRALEQTFAALGESTSPHHRTSVAALTR